MDVDIDIEQVNEEIRIRIREILNEAKISVNKLEKITGLNQRTLQNQINEDVKLTMITIRAIIGLFRDINPLWLLFGDPYKKRLSEKDYEMTDHVTGASEEEKGKYFEAIAQNKGNIKQDLLDLEEIANLKDDEKIMVSRNNFYAPVIPAGCYVFLTRISTWRRFLEYGRVYYIELKDNRDLFACVKPGDDAGTFTLIPLSRQSAPMTLPTTLIKSIWLACRKIEEL